MDHLEEVKKLRSTTTVNCSQSLLVAFGPEIGLEKEEAVKLGAFFGGGMLHGSACGALSGALMVLGMKGYTPQEAKNLIRDFRQKHGATDCATLLSTSAKAGIAKKDHCNGLIFEMCQALDEILSK
jgi:C_GCAxxG_C_C family probable redox protein